MTHVGSRANKWPRRQPHNDPDRPQCEHLFAKIEELKESNALLTEHITSIIGGSINAINQSGAPKPGKVSKALVKNHQVTHFL